MSEITLPHYQQIEPFLIRMMSPGQLLQHYLLSSLWYYHWHESPMTDHAFDLCCQRLLECFDSFEHQHKYLVTKDDLMAGTCLLRENQFPLMVREAANTYLDAIRNGQLVERLQQQIIDKRKSS